MPCKPGTHLELLNVVLLHPGHSRVRNHQRPAHPAPIRSQVYGALNHASTQGPGAQREKEGRGRKDKGRAEGVRMFMMKGPAQGAKQPRYCPCVSGREERVATSRNRGKQRQ